MWSTVSRRDPSGVVTAESNHQIGGRRHRSRLFRVGVFATCCSHPLLVPPERGGCGVTIVDLTWSRRRRCWGDRPGLPVRPSDRSPPFVAETWLSPVVSAAAPIFRGIRRPRRAHRAESAPQRRHRPQISYTMYDCRRLAASNEPPNRGTSPIEPDTMWRSRNPFDALQQDPRSRRGAPMGYGIDGDCDTKGSRSGSRVRNE